MYQEKEDYMFLIYLMSTIRTRAIHRAGYGPCRKYAFKPDLACVFYLQTTIFDLYQDFLVFIAHSTLTVVKLIFSLNHFQPAPYKIF